MSSLFKQLLTAKLFHFHGKKTSGVVKSLCVEKAFEIAIKVEEITVVYWLIQFFQNQDWRTIEVGLLFNFLPPTLTMFLCLAGRLNNHCAGTSFFSNWLNMRICRSSQLWIMRVLTVTCLYTVARLWLESENSKFWSIDT